MDNVITFKAPEIKCSFCGTTKEQAKSMLSSHDGKRHICDKCIAHATQRLKEAS